MSFETLLIDTRGDGPRRTGLITLNRAKQLNALNDLLMDELGAALKAFDADAGIGCIVVTGSEKAFAAGADISAMAKMTLKDSYGGDFITRNWETIRSIRKPVIAAVAGFALGIGCIVITGSEKAFAAGADISAMATKTFADRKSTRLNSSHPRLSRMPSSA